MNKKWPVAVSKATDTVTFFLVDKADDNNANHDGRHNDSSMTVTVTYVSDTGVRTQ